MRILIFNDDYYRAGLLNQGCDVFFAGPSQSADCQTGLEPVELTQVLKQCPFEPELILISDSINIRSMLLGLNRTSIPRAFFGVDTPMNFFWQRDYAQSFDLVFFDQKAIVENLRRQNPALADRFHWLPLAADHRIYRKLDLEKIYDIVFVGSLNDRLRPKRAWILKELQNRFKVQIFDGNGNRSLPPQEVVKIYNQARIVLNENLFPGINLRSFEVMACGSCLLTEYSDGSWSDYFQDGEHLAAFKPDNLIQKVRELLENDDLRESIAEAGYKAVQQEHTIDFRAKQLLEIVKKHLPEYRSKAEDQQRYFHLGKAYLAVSSRWPSQPLSSLKSVGIKILLNLASQKWESAELHFELGAQALTESRRDHALNSFQRALQIEPGHLRSRWGIFWCLYEMGDYNRAAEEIKNQSHHLRMLNRGRTVFKHIVSGTDLEYSDYLFFGELLEKAGWDMDPGIDRTLGHPCRWNAFDAYQKAIACDPKLGTAYYKCAAVLERYQLPEFAVMLAQKAAELNPWDIDLRLRLGVLLLNTYRREEGLQQIVHYLVNSTDTDKWDKVEGSIVTDVEWLTILNRVWDSCHENGSLPPSQNGVFKLLAELNQHGIIVEEKPRV
ncbi:MAG: glycosyltransferase [bacterium]|nr:glycosyltransferase [bacterium]